MARHNEIGVIGEKVAEKWLKNKGFSTIEKNYRKRWGEIDIITKKNSKIHFVEVKTVSYETIDAMKELISRETWRPEENVHRSKLERLSRAIQTWLVEHNYTGEWEFDIITVKLVPREKCASVTYIPDIILDE